MTRVKICGLTRLDDALAAIRHGVDALGFILWPRSKRFIAPDALRVLLSELPPLVTTVGVFVDEPAAGIVDLWRRTGLSAVQLSGDEQPQDYRGLPMPVIKAFRQPPAPDVLDRWPAAAFLADGAGAPGTATQYGGSGHSAQDDVIAALAPTGRLILAGGLTPDTVADRIAAHRPYAVDVASGVERDPGIKDHARIAAFLKAAKGCSPA